MDLKNSYDVNVALEAIARSVIEEVSEKILLKLQENIMKYVYMAQDNSYYYAGSSRPTLQFYRAWKWTGVKKIVNGIVNELYYDWQSMDYDGEEGSFLHGNIYSQLGDAREALADILNVTGNTNKGVGHPFLYKITNKYWDKTILELFDRRRIEIEIMKTALNLSRRIGVTIKKI